VLTKADIKCLKKFGLRPNKIEIIPHGFNPIPFKKEKKDENLVLSVGRFDWNKGQDLLLLAMRKIVEKNPNVKMIIAGKITKKKFYDRVLQLRNKFGLEKNVEIMPDVTHEELVKLYNKASVFVFPSIVDSYGLVNLEAMSVGLPVIASNVGGVSEVVKHKKTGFLIKAGDYEKIAELILRLLKNKKLREKIGKNAINHVKKFSWEKCVKKTMKVYNQMLHKNPLKD
jgi:glycosyltransferase involved in cell wall biosynthesis